MRATLHCRPLADSGRRLDDLINFMHDPPTLLVAFDRVLGNHLSRARTPGVGGVTVADADERIGVRGS